MAVQFGPYFINSETFSTASGVWTSNTLITCAPSGYYSNGVIQRYLTNSGSSTCSLGPVLDCPSCAPPSVACGATYDQGGNAGDMFKLTVGLGTGAGVALIGLNPVGVPDSIAVRFPSGSGTIIVMAAGAAVSAGSSFIQANKQKKIQAKAERDASKFMKDARGKLETNYMEELSLSMEPYNKAREQNQIQSAAQMQQAVEGDERGGAATAGKVLQASQAQEEKIQNTQIGAMQDLEKARQ